MFCKYCGKETVGESEVCEACAAQKEEEAKRANETPNEFYTASPQPVKEEPKGGRMLGFGTALTSAILSVVGSSFAGVAIYLIALFCVMNGAFQASPEELGVSFANISILVGLGVFFLIAGLALGIVSLIFGIRSIKLFIEVKRQGGVKPIATLVLGIVAVDGAAGALIVCIVATILAIAGAALGASIGGYIPPMEMVSLF